VSAVRIDGDASQRANGSRSPGSIALRATREPQRRQRAAVTRPMMNCSFQTTGWR
jgi:hypothetical protein